MVLGGSQLINGLERGPGAILKERRLQLRGDGGKGGDKKWEKEDHENSYFPVTISASPDKGGDKKGKTT